MPSTLRIRELFSSFFCLIQRIAKGELLGRVAEFQSLEISEADDHPIIPTDLSSRQFPQKELLPGVEALLPEILEESKKYGDEVNIFVAITLLETVEETKAKFWFTLKSEEEATKIILEWAQSYYQNTNYMLPSLMTTVYWGIHNYHLVIPISHPSPALSGAFSFIKIFLY